jgi:phage protein D
VKTNAVAGKVTAKGRDPSKKKTFSASSSAATDGGNQSAVEFVTVGDGTGLQKVTANNPSTPASNIATSDSMPSSASSATANAAIARGKQRRSSVNTVKLTMSCIGDPEITAKAMIEVTNIGKSFSGLYYVEKVKHSISSGYTMSLTCKRKGRNSSIGGVTGVAPVGKVNKQSAPDQKSTERIPEVIFEASEDGTGLVQKTVYKKQGKQSK